MRALPLVVLLAATPAAAADGLEVSPVVDGAITAGALAVWGGFFLSTNDAATVEGPPGAKPGGLDSWARYRRDPGISRQSDVVLGSSIALGLGAAAADGAARDQLAGRLLLYGEALALNGMATEIVKEFARRPRPYTWTERLGRRDDDLSFWSGHTSWTACATFTTARAMDLASDLRPAERIGLYGGAGVLTLTVMAMRVGAGMHFPTDVLAGAVVGTAIGLGVPELHRKGGLLFAGAPAPGGGGTLALSGAF